MIIDFTAHIIPSSILKNIDTLEFGRQFPPSKWFPLDQADPEARIRIMKKFGIDMQVLSLSSPILTGTKPKEAIKICGMFNDDVAEMCERYPDRFQGLAAVPLFDVEDGVEELKRSISQLGLKGVMVGTNFSGRMLDVPDCRPFLSEVARHGIPLFIHPMPWKSYGAAEEYRLMHVLGWPFDTTIAMARLIFSGTLDRYPSLRVVTHHLGASLPYLAGRMRITYNMHFKEHLKKPLSEYYKMFYGDTALDGGWPALACGYEFFGPDRMLFGSDYPFGTENGETFIRENLVGVQKMKIPRQEKEKILAGNAKGLLGLD